jgi:hypothetical protein
MPNDVSWNKFEKADSTWISLWFVTTGMTVHGRNQRVKMVAGMGWPSPQLAGMDAVPGPRNA